MADRIRKILTKHILNRTIEQNKKRKEEAQSKCFIEASTKRHNHNYSIVSKSRNETVKHSLKGKLFGALNLKQSNRFVVLWRGFLFFIFFAFLSFYGNFMIPMRPVSNQTVPFEVFSTISRIINALMAFVWFFIRCGDGTYKETHTHTHQRHYFEFK